jgi:hypothetical protein
MNTKIESIAWLTINSKVVLFAKASSIGKVATRELFAVITDEQIPITKTV